MKVTAAQVFQTYFKMTPTEKASKFIEHNFERPKSDVEYWLSDLEIIEERMNERIKVELESKIDTLYNIMLNSIEEQIEKVYNSLSFEDFVNEYFPYRSIEKKIANDLITLEETDKESLYKLGLVAVDNKELFLMLLESIK
jgi:hypothetical protein